MPRSFLVKKNREWDTIYRKLQWSLQKTAYNPDDKPPPSALPRLTTSHSIEPLTPITPQQIHGNIPVAHTVLNPQRLYPCENILSSDDFLQIYRPENNDGSRLSTFAATPKTEHFSATSDDENCSPLSHVSSLGSDGEMYTPIKKNRERLVADRKAKKAKLSCPDCGKLYMTGGGLNKHRQTQCRARQASKAFQCKFCAKEYHALGALKMHLRTHTLPCKCGLCGKAFSRPWLLQGHIRTHTGEKPFSCPHCERAFADRSNLRAHLQTHSDVKRYNCSHCLRSFSRMSLLQKHKDSGCCPA